MGTAIHRIAVLTSGDEAPGMNAAIRAVTRIGLGHGWEVMGVRHGYTGLIGGDFVPLTARDVGGIVQRGGTVLGSLESEKFYTEDGRRAALGALDQHKIDALVVIGGRGSQAGAYALSQMGFAVNGIASSIENDLVGSDITIGVDTAINVAVDTIDRLKIMSSSECYAFLIEVAGRKYGYLALMSGIAGGAEAIVIPEIEMNPEQISDIVRVSRERGKSHTIIVVAEGAACSADLLVRHLSQFDTSEFKTQKTTLGQMQRGSAPSALDRILGTQLGACAVDALARGESSVLAGYAAGVVRTTPLAEVVGKTKPLHLEHIALSEALAL